MEYICKFCSKTYKSIHSRSNHYRIYHDTGLSKSNPKVTRESSKSNPKVTLESSKSNPNNFNCKFCNNIYKYKQGKYKHEKTCKNKNSSIDIIKKENEDIKNKNLELTNKFDQLLKLFKIHPKTLQKINK